MLSSTRRIIRDGETPKRKPLPFLKRESGSPLHQGDKANGTVKNTSVETVSAPFNTTVRRAFEESSTFYSDTDTNDEEQRDADSKKRDGQFSLAVVELSPKLAVESASLFQGCFSPTMRFNGIRLEGMFRFRTLKNVFMALLTREYIHSSLFLSFTEKAFLTSNGHKSSLPGILMPMSTSLSRQKLTCTPLS